VFPARVNDPVTKQPFPNNTIPATLWDPVSAKLLPLYPEPNLPGIVRNFFYNPKERLSGDGYTVLIDHRLSSKDSLFARIRAGTGDNQLPLLMPEPANQQGFVDLTARSAMFSETHALKPNVVNEFRLGQVFTRNNQDLNGPRLFEQYGIKGALDTPK